MMMIRIMVMIIELFIVEFCLIEISIGFGIGKNLVSKKVSDSVSEIFGIEKVSDLV